MKIVGYADGTETNPDGSPIYAGDDLVEIFGEIWGGWAAYSNGLMQKNDDAQKAVILQKVEEQNKEFSAE